MAAAACNRWATFYVMHVYFKNWVQFAAKVKHELEVRSIVKKFINGNARALVANMFRD